MKNEIKNLIKENLENLDFEEKDIEIPIEIPKNMDNGHYSFPVVRFVSSYKKIKEYLTTTYIIK
jgi:arginyl-tRNA synthetase